MAYDFGVDLIGAPTDDDEQQRRAVLTMAPVGGRRITLAPSPGTDLPAPLANLVRNPGNLLMAPVGIRARTSQPASERNSAPAAASAIDASNPDSSKPTTMAPAQPRDAEGYPREPGSGLLLRGRAIAARQGAQGQRSGMALLPMAPMRSGNGSPQPEIAPDLNQMAGAGGTLRRIAAERPDPNAPQYQPRKQGVLRRILTGFALGAASDNPTLERYLESKLEPQSARDYQSDLANWQDRFNTELKIEQAERGEHPNYQFQNIDGRIMALDPRTGQAVRDLGLAGTRAKISKVETDNQGNAIAVFDDGTTRGLGFKVGTKPDRATNPFEAFAYGTPQERQSAQDFLTFEKKIGAQYQRPDEVEERYQLYKRDPEAYKAMFGNRGGAQDQAQAARMLNYFARERQRIEGDWTLDEATRQQRLAEIDQLEQPYLDAAAPSAGPAVQGAADRVTVVSPNGVTGTIPRSQLDAARKKGYRLAQ